MQSTAKTSVREIAPGLYRVAAIRGRSALTGHFLTGSMVPTGHRTTIAKEK